MGFHNRFVVKRLPYLSPALSFRFQVWHYTGTLLHDTKVGKDQELWEAGWQPAIEGQYLEPKISYKPVATSVDAPAQPQGRKSS